MSDAPLVSLAAAQPLPGTPKTVPAWIHLVPAGRVATVDGRGPYRLADAARVAAQSIADGQRLPVDENHATDLAAPQGQPSPARGWIVALEARADGLWGEVEWTPTGEALLSEGAYRHVSPVIAHDAAGTILAVLRASLVNRPNLKGLTALNAPLDQETRTVSTLAALRATLKLPTDAAEADVVAAVEALATRVSAHASTLAGIATAAGLGAAADGAAVLQAVQGLTDPKKMVPADQVVALQSQLAELTTSVKRERATAFVDAAIAAGKVGVKPLRDHFVARHMADPTSVEKEFAALPTIAGGASAAPTKPTPKVSPEASLSEIQAAASAHMAEAAKGGVTLTYPQAVRAVTGT